MRMWHLENEFEIRQKDQVRWCADKNQSPINIDKQLVGKTWKPRREEAHILRYPTDRTQKPAASLSLIGERLMRPHLFTPTRK